MKKIALLFTILCAGQLYGMEEEGKAYRSRYESCSNILGFEYYPECFRVSSWLSQAPQASQQKSQLIQALEKNKNDVEQKLEPDLIKENISRDDYLPRVLIYRAGLSINTYINLGRYETPTAEGFCMWCYHQRSHTTEKEDLDFLSLTSPQDRLDFHKEAQIDGYSAIGAAILAPEVSIESKRNFIAQLLNLGFKLTIKDRMLAEFVVYDSIPENEKEKMILFLREKDLLPEIKKTIVNCMIEPYRITSWPLPEIAND